MEARTITSDFERAAVENATSIVAMFHAAYHAARKLHADGHGRAADLLIESAVQVVRNWAGYTIMEPLPVLKWVRSEPRKGNGFYNTLECGRGHDDRYYWMLWVDYEGEAEPSWETAGVDGDGDNPENIYWGGELSQRTLAESVADALTYQAKWPEAEIRISMGEHNEVMRLSAIIKAEVC